MRKVTTEKLQKLREEYQSETLDVLNAPHDPMNLFDRWMSEALQADLPEPNAMTLATCGADGWPDVRVVLLKGLEANGFEFYTNYESEKGRALEENPKAGLNFLWLGLQRQIRIRGQVVKSSPEVSTAYFQSRPRGSQLGAWASPQSQAIAGRSVIENNLIEIESRFQDVDPIPRPPYWGGYILLAKEIEFWQGRMNRLHDRILYKQQTSGWTVERLAP